MSVDSGLQFVDANILVYAYDITAGEKHKIAKTLINQFWEDKTGCLSIQVLQELYVALTRKLALTADTDMISKIIEDYCVWQIHTPETSDILGAIRIQKRYQLSFWDAMIVRSASQTGCRFIHSEDFSNGQVYEEVRVVNPFS